MSLTVPPGVLQSMNNIGCLRLGHWRLVPTRRQKHLYTQEPLRPRVGLARRLSAIAAVASFHGAVHSTYRQR